MYMYIYTINECEIVAICNGEEIADCEEIAKTCGYDRYDLGWSFSDYGLKYPCDATMTALYNFVRTSTHNDI